MIQTLRPEALTWEQAFRLFSLRCKSQNLSPRTQELYAEKLGAFERWVGKVPLFEVSPSHLRAHLEERKTRGNSDQTVDGAFRVLRTFFRFLHRDGLILIDPMEKVERPRRERRFVKPISEEQLRALLASLGTGDALAVRDHALILFLADTGVRLSEALGMKAGDVDWSSGSAVVFGKGRKERRVAFGQTARRALMSWLKVRGPFEGADGLWVNRFGERLTRHAFEQRFKRHTRAAGIEGRRVSAHALRHFFALQFLRNGGDVMSLQKLLGHSSLAMVRNYVNMTDDDALAKHRSASPLDRMGPLPGERRAVKLS
ncbi:MAG: tyrosine-type recombinase/integrase [Elusimicrobiota bacterium]